MPRTRWLVIGFLLATGIVGGVANARGPFADHPALTYSQFLTDVAAGRVGQIVQWRDRLEVTDGSQVLLVTVPADADVVGDYAQARISGGVPMAWATIPDPWLGLTTPWVPVLILVAGSLIWIGALVRGRRARTSGTPARRTQPAG